MIDPTRMDTATAHPEGRDERSMRLVEYVMAVIALATAVLLSLR